MTTAQFIANCASHNQVKPKTVASVYFDGNHVYSYGYHYPLLLNYQGKWIVNESGYSATTSKHISYARAVADYSIKLNGRHASEAIADMSKIAQENVTELEEQYNALKRKTTQKAEALLNQVIKYQKTLEFLNS